MNIEGVSSSFYINTTVEKSGKNTAGKNKFNEMLDLQTSRQDFTKLTELAAGDENIDDAKINLMRDWINSREADNPDNITIAAGRMLKYGV